MSGGIGGRLQATARRLHRWFFPPAIDLDPRLTQTLAHCFPRLDQRRIRFHDGMPHVLSWLPNVGITLPDRLRSGHARVFIAKGCWQPESEAGLGLILHESFHLQQIQDVWRGWGIGMARPFLVLYLACAAGCGFRYHHHPMERDAYRFAGARKSRFERTAAEQPAAVEPLCACGPPHTADELSQLQLTCGHLVCAGSDLAPRRKLILSTPGLATLWRVFSSGMRKVGRSKGWKAALARNALALCALLLAIPASLYVLAWLLLWTLAAVLLWLADLAVCAVGAASALLLATLGRLFEGPRRQRASS